MKFSILDYTIVGAYFALILGVGLWVSRPKPGEDKTATDYFLAGNGLSWWVIGASLIASNISAEQFIGMSGSGFAIGMGIASYEFMGAITLIVVAVFFMPIFLKMRIYTMPEFLAKRYDNRVKTTMAVFWLLVFVFVNLSSILYLGALTIKNVMFSGEDIALFGRAVDPLILGILLLGAFSAAYSVYGGLKSVAVTDVIQVVFLIGGGLITTYIALQYTSDSGSAADGFWKLLRKAPEKFDMILDKSNPQYANLPGISVIVGGMWIANLYYWGCNQYIIQRALAGKSIREAQTGLAFAGVLKLLLPLIVVIPGIVAFVITTDPQSKHYGEIAKPDAAYPWLLHNFLPNGIKGLAFAALIAAIVSSLASMMNSISTIFTMDIYHGHLKTAATQSHLVKVGRFTSVVALVISIPVAIALQNLDQAFQFIQEFTGFVSPGALAIFLLGFFWKRATAKGALLAAIGTFIFSAALKATLPQIPFLDRMLIVFLLCAAVIAVSAIIEKRRPDSQTPITEPGMFATSLGFKLKSAFIVLALVVIYSVWW
ncbi:sodium/sugar symporter [Turneriella parva]|uniref:SSS sodium solute transporter superfamily n=1 Tax=Turneriella parva (strain ATCC BAA-1111 / DSM 21527 / NCTC 11395 / H) TaxID=869212 RepID=I4B4Z3_TURPD|nr:sodium/sugar symporter [Turneriella parva]AFM12350.1 SSS sodium solute transporter superfamily [Turneriella parva DSM 21527]